MSLFLIQVKQAPRIFHELTQMTLAYQEKNALQHFFLSRFKQRKLHVIRVKES